MFIAVLMLVSAALADVSFDVLAGTWTLADAQLTDAAAGITTLTFF